MAPMMKDNLIVPSIITAIISTTLEMWADIDYLLIDLLINRSPDQPYCLPISFEIYISFYAP